MRTILACLVTTASLLLLTPAAVAETSTFEDGHGTSSGADIHSVHVRHEQRLTITVTHDDIDRGDPNGVQIFIDTRPARDGAELIYAAGISGESDYYIWRARGWRTTGDMPLTCPIGLQNDYSEDWTKATISRRCLGGDTDRVRVSVRASEWLGGDRFVNDWAPGYRTWSVRVDRG